MSKIKCKNCGKTCSTEYWSPKPGIIPAYMVSACCKSELEYQKSELAKTLRDEFAMAALTGLMSNADWFRYEEDSIAERCYALADAMLAVKEGEDDSTNCL